MRDEFHEIDRLNHLLEAESHGHHFDQGEARQLAANLTKSFPAVARTLNLMIERHSGKRG